MRDSPQIPNEEKKPSFEKGPHHTTNRSTSEDHTRNYVGANSAIMYGPSGEWIGGYRKTNLFETDKSWAKPGKEHSFNLFISHLISRIPGTGFAAFTLTLPLTSAQHSHHSFVTITSPSVAAPSLNMSLGICMDLNPQPPAEWTSITAGPYELADHCVKHKSKLLVLLNAWLDPTVDVAQDDKDSECQDETTKEDEEGDSSDDEEPEWGTLNYWSARLRPLWRSDGRRRGSNETIYSNDSTESEKDEYEEAVEDEEMEEKAPHETIVVACNRAGKENGSVSY